MLLKKIVINSGFAHFKMPYSGKPQKTYLVPQPSTVIGILKNIYNDNIIDFIFGYTFETDENLFRDVQTIYKEVNLNAGEKEKDRYKDNKWITDACEIQYLYNPILTIYTNIKEEMSLKEPLVLGKTDCLAKIISLDTVRIKDFKSTAYNQYSEIKDGEGIIQPTTIETKYNPEKGIYDLYTRPLRFNNTIETWYFDETADTNIYLFEYRGVGDICAL